jgi:transposase, IS5 family
MLRTRNNPPDPPWESIIPAEYLRLPAELERVDALLDDERFFTPFLAFFSPDKGRPSVAMETYLRMMFLKVRDHLSYESLCDRVADSISWHRFCRIGPGQKVPNPTTLMKITTRCGPETVLRLNEELLAKANEAKLLRLGKVRADTTVVEANVRYPTDSGLLATAVVRLARLVKRVKAAGGAPRTGCRDRSRAARRRVHSISQKLRQRGDSVQPAVARLTRQLAGLAERAAAEAARVLRNARRGMRHVTGRRAGRLRRAVSELADTVEATPTVVAQARTRLAGGQPDAATRLVSLHDRDARPIVKGRLGKPVEFGYKAQFVDNDDGVICDYTVEQGNPPDAPQLVPAIRRVAKRTGRVPHAVTTDGVYGEAAVEDDLHALGVTRVAIPRKGKPDAARRETEHSRAFRGLLRWRTGCEGRISYLKRGFGLDRSRLDGLPRTRTWCGYGVLAHNLVKIGGLAAAVTPAPSPTRCPTTVAARQVRNRAPPPGAHP